MTLDEATKHIRDCAERMNAKYNKVVFDEWLIVSLAEKRGKLVWYTGPRRDEFQRTFLSDVEALREALLSENHVSGDFEFARHAGGTSFDAFMMLGRDLYLICNHTTSSMNVISKDPLWLAAQVPFVDLSEKFRAKPLLMG
jgi:hypothetical protein